MSIQLKVITSYILTHKNVFVVFKTMSFKNLMRNVALFHIFASLFYFQSNRRQLSSHVCFCVQSLAILHDSEPLEDSCMSSERQIVMNNASIWKQFWPPSPSRREWWPHLGDCWCRLGWPSGVGDGQTSEQPGTWWQWDGVQELGSNQPFPTWILKTSK